MAVTAARKNTITYTGDVTGTEVVEAANNEASPGSVTVQALASGFNTITLPASTGVTVTGVVIKPPTGNTTTITLKGITGDTGVALHPTDPTTLAFASSVTTFGLTAGAAIQGVRFYWS